MHIGRGMTITGVVFFRVVDLEDTMSTQGLRKCRHCGAWFTPHPRNLFHQRFCWRPGCRVASKRASQEKWWHKTPGYFHGEVHVKRVKAWRRKHPGYWKKKGNKSGAGPPDALQELLTSQGFDNQGVKVFRNCLSEEVSRPLQDLLASQSHTLVGLTAMIIGDALQEDIAGVLSTCYERGQRIGGNCACRRNQSPQPDAEPEEIWCSGLGLHRLLGQRQRSG